MTAAYLKSDFQKVLEQQIAAIDPHAPAFFEAPPFVIDCRADAEAFRSSLTVAQIATIEAWHAQGKLTNVSGLARPAYEYAIGQLRERFETLDADMRARVRQLLGVWRAGQAKGMGTGIVIILPVNGIQLPFDASDLMQFA